MPRIVAAARALPRHVVSQAEVKALVAHIFSGQNPDLEKQLRVFDHARIDTRHFVMPPEWYLTHRTAAERNEAYLAEGMALLKEAAERCLEQAGLTVSDVDHLICVSSTGHATPSLDARLIDELRFSPETSRLPIWGLGCAGGAAGLSRAADYCRAYPQQRVLLLALECCSLTFQKDDSSQKNLVGTALFSDGAAAVLVTGSEAAGTGPRVLGRRSYLLPGTSRIMGWDFNDGGMQLVLSPKLPALILKELSSLVATFLNAEGIMPEEILHYVTHPGGAKVIDAYRQALALHQGELSLTEKSLRTHGNVSSVSVLMVLEEWLATQPASRGGYGLISAFGPGFSAEMLLLQA